jgi:hypothetical protein
MKGLAFVKVGFGRGGGARRAGGSAAPGGRQSGQITASPAAPGASPAFFAGSRWLLDRGAQPGGVKELWQLSGRGVLPCVAAPSRPRS